jgi:PleD family two-component response regulator
MSAKRPTSTDSKPGPIAVMVIDDSDVDRQVMIDLLSDAGFLVHALPSPIGATRKARELRVRAVVVDQNLPSLDGSKLAALFRSTASLHAMPVVLVSSSDEIGMQAIARDAKADAFVSKQHLHEELVSTVRRLIAKATVN